MVNQENSLLDRLKAARRLPSPPGVALRVLELCRRDDCEMQEVADVIMSDPALSGRLLKYANSAAVGIGREVTSVREAVLVLGLRAVKLTALGFSLASSDAKASCPGFDIKKFWVDCFITAVIARRLAAEHFKVDREEAFTGGLLAGIGKLAFAQGLPDEYAEVLVGAPQRPLIEREREKLGIDHVAFGAELLADWELPEVLVSVVEHQLEPGIAPRHVHKLASAVQIAVQLSPLFKTGASCNVSQRAIEAARRAVEEVLRLDEERWRQVSEQILTDYLQVADLLDMDLESPTAVLDLYAEAQEEATRVGMVAHLENNRILETNKELLERASTDALTGIANRAKFDEKLTDMVRGLRRGHGDFVLLLFDIDHFKQFNDTYGHDVGDLVLKRLAAAATNALRDVDLLARYGGEEFVVLAPHTDRKGACIIAARLCRAIEQLQIDAKGNTLSVTVSVGLAMTADYETMPDAATLISDADKQLYLSKHNGRNTWSYLGRTASSFSLKRTA